MTDENAYATATEANAYLKERLASRPAYVVLSMPFKRKWERAGAKIWWGGIYA